MPYGPVWAVMTVREVAAAFRVTTSTVRNWARQGRLRWIRTPGWWQAHAPDDYGTFIALERGATTIASFEIQVIPGLLQTEDYSRAASRANRPTARPEMIEEWLTVRARRQTEWFGLDDGPHLWAIVWEAALRQHVGGGQVMRAQLERLAEVSSSRRLTLQVLPFDAGAHAALDMAGFVLFHLAEDDLSTVYLSGPGVNLFLDGDRDVRQYGDAFDRLRAAALSERNSRKLIGDISRELRE